MPEKIPTKVRGVTKQNEDGQNRQSIIKKFVDEYSDIYLDNEPENSYNPNAVAVYVYDDQNEQQQIGYLSDDLANRFHDKLNLMECVVDSVTGGGEGESLGVNIILIINTPEEIEEKRRVLAENKKTETPVISQPIKKAPSKPVSSKSRTIALFLCLLLGIFGGHQFYAGRTVLGFIYLFTGGIFLVGWVIDIIKIITGTFNDKSGKQITNW
ncbi:MAG: hypothetical protein CVU46_10610 [Chloroflexi bacterium HGW-Chloroflexi-8]|jgi:restriction system protein|nr:MAG: hypothetical protein CVU46_10610 [Chloroflexi bacterium HGW-Chloroflexi-8]